MSQSRDSVRPQRAYDDDEDAARNVERLSSIQEATEYTASRSGVASRSGLASRSTGSLSTLLWPFHNRNTSDVQSTPRTSRHMRFRSGQWNSRSLFRNNDDNISIAHSIVPDYVINFMRGETPESLARKKEAKQWGQRSVMVTPNSRDSSASHAVELGFYDSSSTADLTSGDGSGKRHQGSGRHFTGWRGGVLFHIIAALLILVVAVVGFIILVVRTKNISASVVVLSGDCTAASRVNIGLHVVINAFAVALLAGANYASQILTSPTRPEISAAHDRTQWLDIGVSSLRNFTHVSGFRAIVGTIILLTALAIQIIYNAVIDIEQTSATECAVNANISLLGIGALLNIVLIISMSVILILPSYQPLATIGDAIRSFLQIPDHSTINASLLTRADVQKGSWDFNEAKPFVFKTHYWLQAPSFRRWILTAFSWIVISVATIVALVLMLRVSKTGITQPFGSFAPETTIPLPTTISGSKSLLIAVLPQLLLGILYLSVNAHLSTLFLSHELSLFATGPRPLRVSSTPAGEQITGLYLSLPRPVSWLLLAMFTALGLVLSQAVMAIITPSPSQDRQTTSTTASIAFNTQALLVLILLLAILLATVLAIGFRKTPDVAQVSGEAKGNPLAMRNGSGSCSAVISSQCHHSRGLGELWRAPVAWGVVEEGSETRPGHCAFTGNPIGFFDAERHYL